MRASDAERDQVVGQLRERFAEGRISQDTFLYRMDAALRAKGRSELSGLLHDLPGAGPVPLPVTGVMSRLRRATIGRLAAVRRRARGQRAQGQPAQGQPAGSQPAPSQPARSQPAQGYPAWGRPARGQQARRRQAGAELPEALPLCLPPHQNGRFTIGRALACDFTLADLSVSRWHAKLHREEEHWMLSDLGSTNGTRLNGWRVTTGVPVRPGDRVSFGSVTFVITDRPVGAA